MRKWLLGISLIFFGAALVATDADARRLGGGRSVGTQRNVAPPPASAPAKPAQQPQAAPQQPSRWGGIGGLLGGLALGGLLGYLFGGSGLLGLLLLAAVAVAIVFAIRSAMARRAERPRPVQLAGLGDETVPAPPPSQPTSASSASASHVPAGFDTAGFLRTAKMNFIKLQLANDAGRLDEIREFTTREMFDELRRDLPAGAQQTDVVALNADLLELASERDRHWAAVRFSGMVRETPGTDAVGFEEVWNLVKPADGSSGWLLAGIQQMH
ncbi:MAG TPA: Tim44-like domain-containing protein [Burkholderiales bacterium]|nr:Tim44-like domain-containing protein [Burkholderiales bacterium]